eukprot:s669_g21.t1
MTEGCKRYKKPDAAVPAKKVDKKPLKKGVKNVPDKPSIFSDPEDPPDPPMVASGHKDPDPSAPEPQPEVNLEVKTEPKVEVKVEDKKEPMPKGTLSLALQRIHEKLQSPTELLKLHLKHYRMSTEQFQEFAVKFFGEPTFIDHGEVPINAHSKLHFLLLFDGATSLTTAYVVQNRSDATATSLLLEHQCLASSGPSPRKLQKAVGGVGLQGYHSQCCPKIDL